jgi:hypothetical protein
MSCSTLFKIIDLLSVVASNVVVLLYLLLNPAAGTLDPLPNNKWVPSKYSQTKDPSIFRSNCQYGPLCNFVPGPKNMVRAKNTVQDDFTPTFTVRGVANFTRVHNFQ